MEQLSKHWATLRQALGVRQYIVANTAMGATAVVVFALAAMGLSAYFARWSLFLAILFLLLFLFILTYATKLRLAREPKLECDDLQIRDNRGEQFIRVQIHNISSQEMNGLKATLEAITDSAGALAPGETFDRRGQLRHLDYPIQLFTQERLRERRQAGDRFARPFNLAIDERRWIEIFQVTQSTVRSICIFDAAERHGLITPDDVRFDCAIHGAGPPLKFSVTYANADASERSGYAVSVVDENDNVVAEKEFFY